MLSLRFLPCMDVRRQMDLESEGELVRFLKFMTIESSQSMLSICMGAEPDGAKRFR